MSTEKPYGLVDYLADRALFFAAYAIGSGSACAVAFLRAGSDAAACDVAYACVVALTVIIAWAAFDYGRTRRFPAAAFRAASCDPGPGYSSSLPEPSSREQAALKESAAALERALLYRVGAAESRGRAFADYLVSWAHEVKTPVAAALVEIEAPGVPSAIRDSVRDELERVDEGVERVLYSARADSFARDYMIRSVDPLAVARSCVGYYARSFVRAGISFSAEGPSILVQTDPKWLAFAIRQILSNSIKYTPRGGRVTARLRQDGGAWVLSIIDTGRGVPLEDLPRVFERGFTGANGREFPEATGMGLYIVARLCEGMGHAVSASSESGRGTELSIRFGRRSDYLDPASGASVTKA